MNIGMRVFMMVIMLPWALVAGYASPKAGEVFARHVQEAGGAAAFARVKSVLVKGTFNERGMNIDFDLSVTAAGDILLTGKNPEGTQLFRFWRNADGRTWAKRDNEMSEMPDAAGGLLPSVAIAFNPTLPLPFLRDLATATCVEEKEGDKPVFVLIKSNGGSFLHMVFDKESGLLRSLENTLYEDYRPVEGLRFPFAIQLERTTFLISKVVFNQPMDSALFAPPKAMREGADFPVIQAKTRLSADGKLEIVNRPMPANYGRGALSTLPPYDPNDANTFQVDLRGYDARELDLSNRIDDLRHSSFDTKTRWSDKLPKGFTPSAVAEKNKNPGLGVRELHARGITGKGIGIGIIDQALLTEHSEYTDRLRLYEEIHLTDGQAQMHGPAVASIALGKTAGVAPGADLYYIAETHGSMTRNGFEYDFIWTAKSIERLLDVNKTLPPARRIRVISISVGWDPRQKGYAEVNAAVERAKREGVLVVSVSLKNTHGLNFLGLGRDPISNPDDPAVYGPAAMLATIYGKAGRNFIPPQSLLVPMDSRPIASPTGAQDYVFYGDGGMSWAVPWIAGMYALACEVRPDITPEQFWTLALETGREILIRIGQEQVPYGKMIDPASLIERLKKP